MENFKLFTFSFRDVQTTNLAGLLGNYTSSDIFFSTAHITTLCNNSLFSTISHEHLSRDKLIWKNAPSLRKLRKEVTNFNF